MASLGRRIAAVAEGESVRILAERLADAPTIDGLLRLAGWQHGPFERMDRVGIERCLAEAQALYDESFFDSRYRPPPLLREMVQAGGRFREDRRSGADGLDLASAPPISPAHLEGALEGSAETRRISLSEPVAILGDGDLAAELRQAAREAGLPLVEAPGEARLLVMAALGLLEFRRLGLRNALEKSAPGVPVLAHCAPWTVTEISSTLRRTERVAGFASAGPFADASLVEVTRGLNSDESVVHVAARFFRALGKPVVQVGDGPGLVLARVMSMLANECAVALDEGLAQPAELEVSAKRELGLSRGPLEWAETVGLDLVLLTVRTLHQDYGDDRYRPAIRLRRLVQAGRLGRKSGRGFS